MAQTQQQMDRVGGMVKENLKDMPQAAHKVLDEVGDRFDDVRTQAKKAYDYTERTIRDNPFYAIAGATALGIVVGALLFRPRK